MTEGFGKLNFRVEVITPESKAQSLKYLPLGFQLRLESQIINGTPQPLKPTYDALYGWLHAFRAIYFGSQNIQGP